MVKMKYILFAWALLMFSSCDLERELKMQDSEESAGYFLECYFRPGDLYNLTATRLSPASKPQLLDYSLVFQVYVQGDERVKLYNSFFKHPDRDFLYNYGSQVQAVRPREGLLKLEAIAPSGEIISGETIVPEQVQIDTAWVENGTIGYVFDLSGDMRQDYYIVCIMMKRQGELLKRLLNYYDYSKREVVVPIQHEVEIPISGENVDEFIIEIKRVTKENYNYQLALREIGNSNADNLTTPVMLKGNLKNALGIFTCYTEDHDVVMIK